MRSRSASPNMLNLKMVTVSSTPGHTASHGADSMNWRPSRLSMLPQSGADESIPKPRKLSEAAARMLPPTLTEKMMMTGGNRLGTGVRVCGEPIARAASK